MRHTFGCWTFGTYNGDFAGTALGQGTNAGNFSSSSVSGNSYVVSLSGLDSFGVYQAVGLFTLNSDGTVSGVINYNDLSGTGVQSPSPITGGTYTVDAPGSGFPDAGTGRVTITGVTADILTAPLDLQFYLDGNGNVLAQTMDTNDVGSGFGYQQTGGGAFNAASFSGTYVMNATGEQIPSGTPSFNQSEFDSVGPVKADGVETLTGFVDLNWFSGSEFTGITVATVPTPNLTVSGAFTAAANGVFTGTVTGLDVATSANTDAFTYFVIDTTKVLAIETDPYQLTLGYFELQPQK